MIRTEFLGKVGYFRTREEAVAFINEQRDKYDWDTILAEYQNSPDTIKMDYLRLKKLDTGRLISDNSFFRKQTGCQIANHFFNFRLGLKPTGAKSIKEMFYEKIDVAVKKHITLKNSGNISLNSIMHILAICGGQELGNFMPSVAKAVYEQLCGKQGARILDISAGFGGRLIGCMSSKFDFDYTGVDPSHEAIKGLNKLISFLGVEKRARVIESPFEDCEPMLSGVYDFVFTSPPYFKKERYSEEATQSCNRYDDIEAWSDGFLKKSFEICKNHLADGGKMVINIDDVKIGKITYPLIDICKEKAKEVGFKLEKTYDMEMSTRPNGKRGGEPIMVFSVI